MPVNTQVVVITGAGSGVGRETARLLARTGARLVLAGRRMETLQDAAELCRLAGTSAVPLVADTADPAAVQAVADAAVAEFGRIDVWVNNASLASYSRFSDLPLEDFRRVMDVNVMGYVYGCRAALAQMEKQGTGLIINVASIVGEVPQPYTAPYSMSKAAVRALGVSLRSELALHGPHGIRISTVLPPTIDTPFFDHAANYTGRRVRALPPVYPARIVAKHILRLVRRPRPERERKMQKLINLQDGFLNNARRERMPVTVFLVNGFQLRGVVLGFDSFVVMLDSDGKQQMIYKHAISTVVPIRPIELGT